MAYITSSLHNICMKTKHWPSLRVLRVFVCLSIIFACEIVLEFIWIELLWPMFVLWLKRRVDFDDATI